MFFGGQGVPMLATVEEITEGWAEDELDDGFEASLLR